MKTYSEKKLLSISSNIRKIHSGYYAESYELKLGNKRYFLKKYNKNSARSNLQEILKRELANLLRLKKIKVDGITTPKVVMINKKESFLLQEFVPSKSFYLTLLKRCNHFYIDPILPIIFRKFGLFLAKFHRKNLKKGKTNVFGDLNSKNIRFTRKGLFIFDPFEHLKDPHFDLGTVLFNLRVLNPLLYLVISSKKLRKLEEAFLEGYRSVLPVDERKLNIMFKKKVVHEINYKQSNKFIYVLKKKMMNPILKQTYKKIEGESDEKN